MDEIIHFLGYQIYKRNIKDHATGIASSVWCLQSRDNQRSNRVGFGDTIYKSLEEARGRAEFQSKQEKADNERFALHQKQSEETAAKVAFNRGLTIAERRANAVLDKPHRFPGSEGLGNGSLREAMMMAVRDGRFVTEVMVRDHGAQRKDQEMVDSTSRRGGSFGLPYNHPDIIAMQAARARLQQDVYSRTEYRLSSASNGFYVISKTAYDFAMTMISSPIDDPKVDEAKNGSFLLQANI